MLVLTRKVNQSIVIGDNVEIVVLEVRGEQVRIGIKAPKNVSVPAPPISTSIAFPSPGAYRDRHECWGCGDLGGPGPSNP